MCHLVWLYETVTLVPLTTYTILPKFFYGFSIQILLLILSTLMSDVDVSHAFHSDWRHHFVDCKNTEETYMTL